MPQRTRLALVLALVMVSSGALATTVLKIPLEEMARRADLVIRGEVREVQVASDEGGMPTHTVVVLQVAEVMKGQPTGPTLQLQLPGGRNAVGFRIVYGVPGFRPGEEVVLLLERTSAGFVLMGLSEGKFTIRRDLGDVPRALRHVNLRRLIPDLEGRPLPLEGAALDDDLTLEELRSTVTRAKRLPAGGGR